MFVDPDGREAEKCCNVWGTFKSYYSGLYQGVKTTLTGTVNFVKHPVNTLSAQGKAMAKDPVGAMNNQLKSIAKTVFPTTNIISLGYTAATKGVHAAGKEAGSDLAQRTIEATVAVGVKGAGNLISKMKAPAAGAVTEGPNYSQLLNPTNEFDPIKTLYRGTTVSESKSSTLFLTDNAEVAGTYTKNGGEVMQYDLSTSSLYIWNIQEN